MNVYEMMDKMDAKLQAEAIAAEERAEAEEKERQLMIVELLEKYGKRIDDITALLRYCIERKIAFPNGKYQKRCTYAQHYNDFMCDGIRHLFGGVCFNGRMPYYLGWKGVGSNSDYDILVNSSGIMVVHEDRRRYRDIKKTEIEKFEADFIKFERDILEWFENELA